MHRSWSNDRNESKHETMIVVGNYDIWNRSLRIRSYSSLLVLVSCLGQSLSAVLQVVASNASSVAFGARSLIDTELSSCQMLRLSRERINQQSCSGGLLQMAEGKRTTAQTTMEQAESS